MKSYNEISYVIENVDVNNQNVFDVYSANALWRDYWKSHYQNEYSNDTLATKNKELEEKLLKAVNDINKLLKVYKDMLDENIELGERIEDLKYKNRELNTKIINLKQDVDDVKDTSIFNIGYKVLKQATKNKELEEKLNELQSKPNMLESVANKDPDVFNKIAKLYLAGCKQKDIAEQLNISTATVSRYLNKQETKRELQAEQDNANTLRAKTLKV